MLAKQKLVVYLKKSVRWDNMSVKKTQILRFVIKQKILLFKGNFNTPITAA